MALLGSEVKALRGGGASLSDAYAGEKDGQLYLFNAHIPEYKPANKFNHEPKRPRLLLVKAKERDRLLGSIRREGTTIIPLSLFFNSRGLAKCLLGLAKGKRKEDKREATKDREWKREQGRAMKKNF
jgi:SsrA-binding protein